MKTKSLVGEKKFAFEGQIFESWRLVDINQNNEQNLVSLRQIIFMNLLLPWIKIILEIDHICINKYLVFKYINFKFKKYKEFDDHIDLISKKKCFLFSL